MDGWPSVSEILRFYRVYERYSLGRAVIAAELSMLRGRRVDLAAEYMARGATLPRAHCASHLRERANRRNDESIEPYLRQAMNAEADLIAFGKEPDSLLTDMWIDKNGDCVCIGYLNAAAKFLREHPLTLVEAQFTVVNRKLRYVGHPDHLVQTDKGYILLSIKTGELPNFAGVQEALYLLADPLDWPWPVNKRYEIARAVVQFRADGGYTYQPLTDHNDFAVAERWAAGFWDARKINGECE